MNRTFRIETKDGKKYDVVGFEIKLQEDFGPSVWMYQEKAHKSLMLEEVSNFIYNGDKDEYKTLIGPVAQLVRATDS